MPVYLYRIKSSDERFEVKHSMSQRPQTLGELCQVAGLELNGQDPDLEIERLIQPVGIAVSDFRADIRDRGFSKLVKRSDGNYENVTARK